MTVDIRARAEDIRWMAATGESLSGAAKRLGLSSDGVVKWAHAHGLTDELAKLRAREPGDPVERSRSQVRSDARWAS